MGRPFDGEGDVPPAPEFREDLLPSRAPIQGSRLVPPATDSGAYIVEKKPAGKQLATYSIDHAKDPTRKTAPVIPDGGWSKAMNSEKETAPQCTICGRVKAKHMGVRGHRWFTASTQPGHVEAKAKKPKKITTKAVRTALREVAAEVEKAARKLKAAPAEKPAPAKKSRLEDVLALATQINDLEVDLMLARRKLEGMLA